MCVASPPEERGKAGKGAVMQPLTVVDCSAFSVSIQRDPCEPTLAQRHADVHRPIALGVRGQGHPNVEQYLCHHIQRQVVPICALGRVAGGADIDTGPRHRRPRCNACAGDFAGRGQCGRRVSGGFCRATRRHRRARRDGARHGHDRDRRQPSEREDGEARERGQGHEHRRVLTTCVGPSTGSQAPRMTWHPRGRRIKYQVRKYRAHHVARACGGARAVA